MSKRNIIFILFILFGISGLFTYFQSLPSLLEKKPTLATGKILARPMEIDQFELIDQNNAAFNNKSLKGGWTVVFFGYTTVLMFAQPLYINWLKLKMESKKSFHQLTLILFS